MRAVVQRVSRAKVTVDERETGAIEQGLLVFLGVETGDGPEDLAYICQKVAGMRVFEDDAGKMNLDVSQVGGRVLLVSQFTLCGDMRRGRRPSFTGAAAPDVAQSMYEQGVAALRDMGLRVETGQFQAHMMVELTNDGPVTLLLDSKRGL